MVILHFANICVGECNGVSTVVPQHIIAQQQYATIGFVNITNQTIGCENQFEYCKEFDISQLKPPFDKPDLIVFHELYMFEYIKLYKTFVERGLPYIIVPHGELTYFAQKKKRLKKVVANLLFFNKFISYALAVQCLSENEFKNIKSIKNRKFIATNGIKVPGIFKTEFSEETIKLLYIGRLEIKIKGIDLLLKAVKSIKEFLLINKCRIYIYGPNVKGRYDKIKKMINSFDLSNVVFLNEAIVGQKKEVELLSADCFIQTSRSEGMPSGILEAMAYGLPCIVTKGTSLGDFIYNSRAGWVCETDSYSIANGIVDAIKNRDTFPAKSVKSRSAVMSKFSWEVIARETVDIYEEILSSRLNV